MSRLPERDGDCDAIDAFAAARSPLPSSLTRVLDWLRDHLDEPVRLDELSELAGVRPRTLQTHFKQFLRTTPLGWMRRMRLLRARRELLSVRARASVSDIALGCGFPQLGRFAAQYCAQFGELPSETMRRVRASRSSQLDDLDDEALRLTFGSLHLAFAVAPKQCAAALEDLARAQELAPGYGLPKAIAAWCLGQRSAHRFSETPQADRVESCRLADEAQGLAPSDAMVLTLVSGAFTLAYRLDEADQAIERALALDPCSPWAWARRGWLSAYLGDCDASDREFKTALHLMPFEPLRHLTFIGVGCAHFAAGRYERAALWARTGLDAYPESFWAGRIVAAAAAHAGALEDARRAVKTLLRRDPHLTVAEVRNSWPFRPEFMTRLGDGLAVAGLPRA